jgi:toxin-antitoxin system PIN domain toxin
VTLVDANILLYAANRSAPEHERARTWLDAQLSGTARVGLPWPSLLAFVRLATNPLVITQPATMAAAWAQVEEWLFAEAAWVPAALLARPEDVPTTWAAAQAYLQRMYASGTLAVGQDGRAVGQAVLSPPLGPLAMPLTAIVRFVTRAWLPEEIRRAYGLSWTEADARRLPRVLKALRAVRRALPARAAKWSASRT